MSDGMRRELAYLSSHATNRYFIPNWGIYMPLADIFFPRMYQAPDGFMAVRIALMYYVDFYSLFNNPEKEWDIILSKAFDAPSEPSLFD